MSSSSRCSCQQFPIPFQSPEATVAFSTAPQSFAFVPTRGGTLEKVADTYHPDTPLLSALLDPSTLPVPELSTSRGGLPQDRAYLSAISIVNLSNLSAVFNCKHESCFHWLKGVPLLEIVHCCTVLFMQQGGQFPARKGNCSPTESCRGLIWGGTNFLRKAAHVKV